MMQNQGMPMHWDRNIAVVLVQELQDACDTLGSRADQFESTRRRRKGFGNANGEQDKMRLLCCIRGKRKGWHIPFQ